MQRLSDGRDLVSLGQVCPELGTLAEDRLLWKRLCQYHFTDRQARRNDLFLTMGGNSARFSAECVSAAVDDLQLTHFVWSV